MMSTSSSLPTSSSPVPPPPSGENPSADAQQDMIINNSNSNSPWSSVNNSRHGHISLDSLNQQQQQQPPSSYPSGGGSHSGFGGSITPLQPGEEEGEDNSYLLFNAPPRLERPTSAPPPGFSSNSEDTSHFAHPSCPPNSAATAAAASSQNQQQQQQHHAFSNLAAVLGTGLAESMMLYNTGDATSSSAVAGIGGGGGGGGGITSSSTVDSSLNWQRQSRHAASRLLGVSPPNTNKPSSSSSFVQQLQQQQQQQSASPLSGGGGVASGPPPTITTTNTTSTLSSGGFPSALSTPSRTAQQQQQLQESGKPQKQLHEQQQQQNNHHSFNSNIGIGMNVVEPDGGGASGLPDEFQGLYNSLVTSRSYGGGMSAGTTPTTANTTSYPRNFPAISIPTTMTVDQLQQQQQQQLQQQQQQESFLWSPNAPEFIPYDSASNNFDNNNTATNQNHHLNHMMGAARTTNPVPSNISGGRSVDSGDSGGGGSLGDSSFLQQQAEAEIAPFLWDCNQNRPSRCICILRVQWLRAPDVRAACETYGVLDSFRADFASRFGIYFCSYYDIRSAQYAAAELQSVLQRMVIQQTRMSSETVLVKYCLALSSSSPLDEAQLSLTDLPIHVEEHHLSQLLSSYGAVRSVYPHGPMGSFLVEFYSVQDAKQALLELDSSQPWGSHVCIETGVRNPVERKRGRELLATLSRWRQQINATGGGGGGGGGVSAGGGAAARSSHHQFYVPNVDANDPWGGTNTNLGGVGMDTFNPNMTASTSLESMGFGGVSIGGGGGIYGRQNHTTTSGTPQIVLGPDGRYQVVMVGGGGRATLQQQQPQAQQLVQGPNGQLYVIPVQTTTTSFLQAATAPQMQLLGNFQQQQQPATVSFDRRPAGGSVGSGAGTNMPYYTHHVVAGSDVASIGSGRSFRSTTSTTDGDNKDNRHLTLDLEEVESGIDTRTSLMVRNIPNKYTQQMLLAEFEENGHGPGVIDFFYLPIDFKNRCNRGYAFINFVDYHDILLFHRRYFGKHWRTFNSDKICDITYARIQGKAAMLKRFENSALMEKDDEYKPLVFVSDGPNKGQRLPFPGPGATMATTSAASASSLTPGGMPSTRTYD